MIALGFENRCMSAFRDRQEMVRMRCRLDGINGDLDIAVRTVFESDRTRQTR